jgi:hypothetical protein
MPLNNHISHPQFSSLALLWNWKYSLHSLAPGEELSLYTKQPLAIVPLLLKLLYPSRYDARELP